jgi:hypothetical protein
MLTNHDAFFYPGSSRDSNSPIKFPKPSPFSFAQIQTVLQQAFLRRKRLLMGTTGNQRKMQGEEVLTLACCCMSGCAVTAAVTFPPAIKSRKKNLL